MGFRPRMSDTVSPTIGMTNIGVPLAAARRLALPCIVLLAAIARLWHLGQAGFGTEYYAAAVQSMLADPWNMLYGAFDPAGILAVDKPPLAFWLQTLSAGLLGFRPFALMLPQAIEGCLAVILVWHLARRDFGETVGLLAALFLALTPIAIAVDRSNNTDSLLVLVLLLAAWAMPRGGDPAAPWRLLLAMALTGVAFNVKMLAAFGALPGFAASYFLTTRVSRPKRLLHLAAGGTVLVAVSVSWMSVVALTPSASRPYVDSTTNNSIFDLAVNHNALQRFVPRAWLSIAPQGTQAAAVLNRLTARSVPPGPARLIDPRLARQSLWLLPLALAGAVGMVLTRRLEAACVWVGWMAAYWVVFSVAGGLFSPYYLVMLGPPLAVLAAVGVTTLMHAWKDAGWKRWWLPASLVLSVAWQANLLRPGDWDGLPGVLLIAATAGILLSLVALRPWGRGSPVAALTLGVAALLIAPAAWSIGTIAYEGGRPVARLQPVPGRFGRDAFQQRDEILALLPFLRANQGDAAFLAATSSALLAAPLIIASGDPVMAFGGFMGTIPVADGALIAQLVDKGDLRFAILGETRRGGAGAADIGAARWIRAHGTRLDLASISPALSSARFEVFDLRHDQPLGSAPGQGQ